MNTGKTIATDTLKNNVITTKELAKALGVDIKTVNNTVERLLGNTFLKVWNKLKTVVFQKGLDFIRRELAKKSS